MRCIKRIICFVLAVIFAVSLLSGIVRADGKADDVEAGELYNNTSDYPSVMSFSFLQTDCYTIPLDGARYALFYDRGCTRKLAEAESGPYPRQWGYVVFENVPFPSPVETVYYMRQTAPPSGYLIDEELYLVRAVLSGDGSINVFIKTESDGRWTNSKNFYIKNYPVSRPKGSVSVSLSLSGDIPSLSGQTFSFGIYNEIGTLTDSGLLTNGGNTVKELVRGTYTLRQINPQTENYEVSTYINGILSPSGEFTFTLDPDETIEIFIENIYKAKPPYEICTHCAYISGYPDGTVRPYQFITRAETAEILWQLMEDEDRALYYKASSDFSDVDANGWYSEAVSTLENAGIITGYADGTFCPEKPVTRAELVKLVLSFLKIDKEELFSGFTDISGHWAQNYIQTAAVLSIVQGYPDGSFAPDKYVARSEAAAIINRAIKRAPIETHLLPDMICFPDNPPGTWFYADIQEAANSHTCRYIYGGKNEEWLWLISN